MRRNRAGGEHFAGFETTKGEFVVEAIRAWAPHGVDRFYNLARIGFFDDLIFFRVISGFMVQFGVHGDPEVSAVWRNRTIPPDPVRESNRRGYVSFAMAGSPDTRTTQLFINFRDNTNLDDMGFAPAGRVVEGMDVVDNLYAGYGARSNNQRMINVRGNAFLREQFPRLDSIKKAVLID